jgi:hypothetical protein
MLTDLRLDLRKDSVDNYIDSLMVEMDKLRLSYESATGIGDNIRMETIATVMQYVRQTQAYNSNTIIPPRDPETPPDDGGDIYS